MRYHPKVIDLLSKFKNIPDEKITIELLTLILDHTSFIDLEVLSDILFSYTSKKDLQRLEDIIHASFIRVNINRTWVCYNFMSRDPIVEEFRNSKHHALSSKTFSRNKNFILNLRKYDYSDEYFNKFIEHTKIKALSSVLENLNKEKPSDSQLDKSIFNSSLKSLSEEKSLEDPFKSDSLCESKSIGEKTPTPLKTTSTKRIKKDSISATPVNTLKFEKVESKIFKEIIINKFMPLELKYATFVYDRKNIILTTQRKRDDLVNPVKLQFIKHYDQKRPPIYQVKGKEVFQKYSYLKIPEVISYDYDSSEDWDEVDDEVISCSTIDESTVTESNDESGGADWIEADTSEEEIGLTRNNKKPSFNFVGINIEKFCEKDKFRCISLEELDYVPYELKFNITEILDQGIDPGFVSKIFSISLDKIKELLIEK